MAVKTVAKTNLYDLVCLHRGKVRDVYVIGKERLLLVATDRISAFDCVMPNQIPLKGIILNQISSFWFKKLRDITKNHLITANFDEMPEEIQQYPDLKGRAMIVKRSEVFPIEFIVRGYLEGSGWKNYREIGEISGNKLPQGLKQCEKLPKPIFTPSTKASSGHDENIDMRQLNEILGSKLAETLKNLSIQIYESASKYAFSRGIIIADTKFEFGRDADGNILLIDEVLTPDSSRFWSVAEYSPGKPQISFDKQFVREYLETLTWDKQYPAPELPKKTVDATTKKYLEAYKLITGKDL